MTSENSCNVVFIMRICEIRVGFRIKLLYAVLPMQDDGVSSSGCLNIVNNMSGRHRALATAHSTHLDDKANGSFPFRLWPERMVSSHVCRVICPGVSLSS
jgi:hypothetical protein